MNLVFTMTRQGSCIGVVRDDRGLCYAFVSGREVMAPLEPAVARDTISLVEELPNRARDIFNDLIDAEAERLKKYSRTDLENVTPTRHMRVYNGGKCDGG